MIRRLADAQSFIFQFMFSPSCVFSSIGRRSRYFLSVAIALLLSAPLVRSQTFLDPFPNLGQAGGYTVLDLSGNGITDTMGNNGATQITGDIGVAAGNNMVLKKITITGTIYQDAGANIQTNSGNVSISGGIMSRDMSQASTDAVNAATTFAAMSANQSYTAAQVNNGISFTTSGTTTVININGNLSLTGSSALSFTGTSANYYIVNVTGTFSMAGASTITLSGGMTAQNLIFNIEASSGTGLVLNTSSGASGTFLNVNSASTIDKSGNNTAELTGAILGAGVSIGGTGTSTVIAGAPIPSELSPPTTP
jgi:hypothetical protein